MKKIKKNSYIIRRAEYRYEIANAVENANIMILLLNEAWATSRECEDEFNYAKRLNLTSQG